MPLWPTPSHPGHRTVRRPRLLPATAPVARTIPQVTVAVAAGVPTKSATPTGGSGFPDVFVDIAFDDVGLGPLIAMPTWVDVSADVIQLEVTRGRQTELGRFDTGTMTVRLRNTHGNYDPSNIGGDYAPNVLPMKQIRARARYQGVYYPLFRGFIEEYNPSIVGSANAEMALDCTDAFAWLANITIAEPLFDEAPTGQRILDLLADPSVDWAPTLYSVRTTVEQAEVVEIDDPEGSLGVLDAMQQAADSEVGDLYVTGAGVVEFRDRRQKIEIAAAAAATFGDDITSELPYTGLDPTYGVATVVNHAVVSLPDWEPSEFEDATSRDTYGIRSSSYDTQLLEPEEADLIANLLVWRGKDPRTRFTAMQVKPAAVPFSATALWVATLAAEIGTVWEVNHRPPNVGTVTQTAFVQGLNHRIDGSKRTWLSRFVVAQPDPEIDFFTIEDVALGVIEGDGAIAY